MKVVHCRKEPFDVLIDRSTQWGNPFLIGKDGTREEVITKHKEWILTQPELLAQLYKLKGKTLGCWCSPAACHGNTLSELANGKEEWEKGYLAECWEDSDGEYSHIQVMKSAAGWYIGTTFTHNEDSEYPGMVEPGSRESGYYALKEEAEAALKNKTWEQRLLP